MSSLSVSVTAETQDLEAKLAVAQAQLRAFQAELRNTANAAVQSGTALDDMSRAKLGQLASQVDQAQGRVSYFKASLSELGPAANQASLHASTLTRETRALIAELSRGEFLRAGGTIALLGEHLAELGPAALAGIAGVAAMGAGLAYMIVQGQSAQKALDDIQGQMILVGRGASFSAEAAQGAMDQLEKSFGLSASSAAVVEKEIAKIPIATDATRQAVSLLAVAYAHLNSETPEKAAQTVAKAFAGGGEAALQFAQQLRALTPAQQLALREAQRHSDVLGAQAILTDALSSRLGHFVDYLKQLTEWWDKARIAALTADTAMGQTVEDIIGPKPTMPTGSGPGTGAADQQALDITLRYRDVVDQIRDREKDIKILKEGIKTASGDVLATETHALQVAEKQLQDLKTQGQGSALEQDRAQLVQELALSQGGHQQQLQETVTFWQNVLNTQKLSAKERLQVETELANAQKQLNQAKHADDLAEAQSHQQVVIAGYQFEEEQARTALATGQITLEQEYQRLKDVENRKIAAVIEYLQRKMELEGASAAAIQQLKDQETIAEYEHDQKMLRIDQDYYQQKKQLAEQDLQSEKGILGELTRLESGLVSSILSSRQRLSVSLIQLAEQTVAREIEADLKALTISLFSDNAKKASEQGGVLWHAIAEATKTKETIAGVAQRTGAENAGQTTFLGRIVQGIARWLGFETTKTATTETESAARTAAEAAAATASKAVEVATGFGEIQIDASVGAAAAFADMAQLGPEGLAAAPGVAAATYATILGYASGLGAAMFDQGAWELPSDMHGVTVHRGETIMPASFAQGWRDAVSGGGGLGGGGPININVSAVDARSFMSMLRDPTSPLTRALAHAARNNDSHLRGILKR